jgi:hypothetical protein
VSAHPLFQKLRARGEKGQAELTTMVGFLGDEESDGSVKLYLDLSFGSYCKIPTSDIVNIASVDPGDENSPTIVWMPSSSKIELVKVLSALDGASFVKGRIQQERLNRVAPLSNHEMLTDASTWTCPRETLDNCGRNPMWCDPTVYCPQ